MATSAEIRDELQELVINDLLGPAGGPEEIVRERYVSDRYLVGRLAPKGKLALPEETDERVEAGVDGEDGHTEAPPANVPALVSNSIGLSFAIAKDSPSLTITARWGRYTPVHPEDDGETDGYKRADWQREAMEGTLTLPLVEEGRIDDWAPCPEQPEVIVQGLIRERHGLWVVTLFLVNSQTAPKQLQDVAWVFQPELLVEGPDGEAVFCKHVIRRNSTVVEEQAIEMLYRRTVQFAVGHGVAVHADVSPDRYDRAVRLKTQVIPTYELWPTVLPPPDDTPALSGLVLDMQALSEVPDGGFADCLAPLTQAYGLWIEQLAARIQDPDASLQPYVEDGVAELSVEGCQKALDRIQAAIDLLDANPMAAKAFRFANRAMALQRVRGIVAEQVHRGEEADLESVDVPANRSWRVFQLGFILLNLPALVDPTHPERSDPVHALADLLWFPTGGGKTEAYLGVAAFAMAIRRLQGEVGGRSGHAGVTVLMRYTLRLLTLQQFQRASTLICACEVIRREEPTTWGSEPFRIGLWVGRRSTPNWTKDANAAVQTQRNNKRPLAGESSPHQLSYCPWCGSEINPGKDIEVELAPKGRGRTFTYCSEPLGRCPFSRKQSPDEGIPAIVVDEEIYRRLPSLLIATVDKFAQMPWNGRTAMLFGQVDGYCERHGFRSPEIEDAKYHQASGKLPKANTIPMGPLRPPDLIIQDELHLISGPLGTLVGLYETAVDRLASWEVDGALVHPKVIASTATIRRAGDQVNSVFARQVEVFPPHGLDVDDSFFSRQKPPSEEEPGRRYMGICATGVRQRAANIRTYVTYLAAAQKLFLEHGLEVDPWMTLIGYFNSLRELGSMRRAVDDTVASRLKRTDERNLANRDLSPYSVQELTSRLGATDIPKRLDELQTPFGITEDGQPTRKSGEDWALDVLLATNMISVGVDVSRLGLMLVASQPKTTAEYIQATSRVGRRHPGLVATLYGWSRPRDLSHYEQFEHYHATFYQYVEALSVTPFAPRAIDRGLAGVLVSLARLLDLDLNDNEGAGRIDRDASSLVEAKAQIASRVEWIAGPGRADAVRAMVQQKVDHWLHRAGQEDGAQLGYRSSHGTVAPLLKAAEAGRWDPYTCLNSLRDVEPSVHLLLDEDDRYIGDLGPWQMPDTAQPETEEND